MIASNYGIEAARQHLGHRDIRTTSSHYADKKSGWKSRSRWGWCRGK